MKNKIKPFKYKVYFSKQEIEIAEWLKSQPNPLAYIKELILADKARKEGKEIRAIDFRTQYEKQWDDTFALLQEFVAEHGRLPFYNEEYKGVQIDRWLKRHLEKDKDRPARMEKLKSLNGLSKWEQHYQQLQTFMAEHGRLPKLGEKQDGFGLGRWVHKQRQYLNSTESPLTPVQQEMFARLGIGAGDWETKFLMLQDFHQDHGRFPKHEEVYHGMKLGRWLSKQKRELAPETDGEKIAKLTQIGAWKPIKPPKEQS